MDQNTGRENAATTGARAPEQGAEAQATGIDAMLTNARDLANRLYMAVRDIHEVTSSNPASGQTRRDAKIFAGAMLLGVQEYVRRLEPKPQLAGAIGDLIGEQMKCRSSEDDAERTELDWMTSIHYALKHKEWTFRQMMTKIATIAVTAIESQSKPKEVSVEDVVRDAAKQGLNIYQLSILTGRDVGWVEAAIRGGE